MAPRFALAGRLLSQTRSAAPAVLRLVLRAGRLRAISSWVRPESTLVGVGFHVPARRGELVALLDEQPLVSFAAALHVDQGEIAVELLAVQAEFQVAARQLFGPGGVAQQFERAAVPQHHAARAVVAGRNVAFEIAVLDGVVLDMGGEVLHRGIERRALGHGPGFQHAVDFQPEIVVQPRGIVPLHAEVIAGALAVLRRRGGSGVFSNRRLARTLREA